MAALDAGTRQPVEDAELLLAQPLVDDQLRRVLSDAADRADQLRRRLRAAIRRDQHDVRTLIRRQGREPPAKGDRLLLAQAAQGDVGISDRNVDLCQSGGVCCVTCDIAGALPMSNDPKPFRPTLLHNQPPAAVLL